MGLSVEQAALGIIRIAVANMSRAIPSVSTAKGHDAREFVLFAYGGAGPLHAASVAAECGIRRVLVPVEPGTMCARGILLSDLSLDLVRSEITIADDASWPSIMERFATMQATGTAWLESENILPERRRFDRVIEARYKGQNHEIQVCLAGTAFADFVAAFTEAHRREYGYDIPDRTIEVVNCRLKAIGLIDRPAPEFVGAVGAPRPKAERQVHFDEGLVATPVFARADLAIGTRLVGPSCRRRDERDDTGAARMGAQRRSHRQSAAGACVMSRLADPIAMEVFSNRLLSITEDMGNTLIRSSFSTNIKERKDCSVGLFDARGRLIAQAAHIPLHLGSLLGSVQAVLARYEIGRMRDGDAFVLNDPYLAGGTHMPDISIVTPMFIDGAVRAFAASVGHHSDVGGPVPGSISGRARSVFEEGLRLPVIRLVRGGELDEDLLALIANNSRDPDERSLDLKVQVATNARGVALMRDLVGRVGLVAVTEAIDDLLAYTARRLRNRLRDMVDGESSFTAFLDDDGIGGDPGTDPRQGDRARRRPDRGLWWHRTRNARRVQRAGKRAARHGLLHGEGTA